MDLLDFWKCHLYEHADYLFLLVPQALRHNATMTPKREYAGELSGFFYSIAGSYAGVDIVLRQDRPATGSIDLDTRETLLDADVTLGSRYFEPLDVPPGCRTRPISLTIEGSYDAATGILVLADAGFALSPSIGCGVHGLTIDNYVSGLSTSLSFQLRRFEPADPPEIHDLPASTQPIDPPEATPIAPPASAVPSPARFTG